ncbi:hypothetical protein Mrose_02622 [Calidithermus roseus]|uniref:Lipoprotein n=2 Tax=Calidithermus roseus TaxID=1644118 RepID=A0A399EM67_9DEIN|nr:hypothetical protein Mrose_02622 [Calidithermus roseus]
MGTMRRLVVALAGLVVLSGCVPVAVLRTPQPVSGESLSVGLSGLFSSDGGVVIPVAYYARGDGETEYNLSAQAGLRLGIKQRLADSIGLDAGLTVPYVLLSPGTTGIPLVVDLGLLIGVDRFYLSPRVDWIGFTFNGQAVSGLIYHFTGGYAFEDFLLELSYLNNFQGGGGAFSISGAWKLL